MRFFSDLFPWDEKVTNFGPIEFGTIEKPLDKNSFFALIF